MFYLILYITVSELLHVKVNRQQFISGEILSHLGQGYPIGATHWQVDQPEVHKDVLHLICKF